jgi:hypothetical protein
MRATSVLSASRPVFEKGFDHQLDAHRNISNATLLAMLPAQILPADLAP